MSNHLKRIAVPKTWHIDRKSHVFVVRPRPGGHSFDMGMALGLILRDVLGLATTMSEVKKMLHSHEIKVDGKRRRDARFLVGLFDVIEVGDLGKFYRLSMDLKGRLTLKEISADQATLKVCRIVGKSALRGGKIQFNLHDGKNIISDSKAKVGDSFLISLPDLTIKEELPLKKGVHVFMVQGKHSGSQGVLAELGERDAILQLAEKKVETVRRHLFVIGGGSAVLEL